MSNFRALSLRYTGTLDANELGDVPRVFHLPSTSGNAFRLGRATDNEYALYSSTLTEAVRTVVSRYHAQINVGKYGYSIVDLGSMNGTFVDGVRIAPNKDEPIVSGSIVVIGGCASIGVGELPPDYAARGRQLLTAFEFTLVDSSSVDARVSTSPALPRAASDHADAVTLRATVAGAGGGVNALENAARVPREKNDHSVVAAVAAIGPPPSDVAGGTATVVIEPVAAAEAVPAVVRSPTRKRHRGGIVRSASAIAGGDETEAEADEGDGIGGAAQGSRTSRDQGNTLESTGHAMSVAMRVGGAVEARGPFLSTGVDRSGGELRRAAVVSAGADARSALASGFVTLDSAGTARVPLPKGLTFDSRIDGSLAVTLTPIGSAMPSLHVVEGVLGSVVVSEPRAGEASFAIAGGLASGRVMWIAIATDFV